MIKLLRVDYRLIHGQVALSWTQAIGADCLLLANDSVVHDDIRKTTLKLARPSGCKLVIKSIDDAIAALNSGVTDKYSLFVIVESIEDAFRLIRGTNGLFTSVNLGGTKPHPGADHQLATAVFATEADIELLRSLLADGIEIEIRQVPTERKLLVQDVL